MCTDEDYITKISMDRLCATAGLQISCWSQAATFWHNNYLDNIASEKCADTGF